MSISDHIEGFFEELNMASVAVRLILATLLGSFVGMERAHKRYAAGIRTFALVCLGSALATMIGLYLGEISALGADVGRIPAQILCGIGFLGAGTIIVTERKQVKGLTTAAGLWVTATMGMAIGAGFVFAAIVCFVLIFLNTYYMYYMARYVENHTRTIEIYAEMDRKGVEPFLTFLKESGYVITSIERRKDETILEDDIALRVELDMLKKRDHAEVLDEILTVSSVHYVEEIS